VPANPRSGGVDSVLHFNLRNYQSFISTFFSVLFIPYCPVLLTKPKNRQHILYFPHEKDRFENALGFRSAINSTDFINVGEIGYTGFGLQYAYKKSRGEIIL
jgi:hypothetical protein